MRKFIGGDSLEVHWLGFHTFTVNSTGLISGWGTEINWKNRLVLCQNPMD